MDRRANIRNMSVIAHGMCHIPTTITMMGPISFQDMC